MEIAEGRLIVYENPHHTIDGDILDKITNEVELGLIAIRNNLLAKYPGLIDIEVDI